MATQTVTVQVRDAKKYDCINPTFIYLQCEDGHWTKKMARCREYSVCELCRINRIKTFLAKAYDRYGALEKNPQFINMWTYGTSLIDTETNRRLVISMFQKFNKQMKTASVRNNFRYNPQLWVLEAGSKGNRLHIHSISFGFSPHKENTHRWRKITGEKSNVNFSISKHNSPKAAFRYASKYVAKEGARYYWMGNLLSSTNNKQFSWSCFCGSGFDSLILQSVVSDSEIVVYYHKLSNFSDNI